MRPVVMICAVVAAIGALGTLGTFAFVRLAGTLEQLHSLDVAVAPARAVAPPGHAIAAQPASPSAEESAAAAAPADDGDHQIQTWLVADAEFQRAAAELLNDPDPHVQVEARALLRGLGADVP